MLRATQTNQGTNVPPGFGYVQDYKSTTLVVRDSELRPFMYLVRGKGGCGTLTVLSRCRAWYACDNKVGAGPGRVVCLLPLLCA